MDELNNIFEALAGTATGGGIAALGGVAPESAASSVLGTVLQAVTSPQSTAASPGSSSSGGIGSTLESVGLDVLKSGFGMVSIIGGLLHLFGGGDSTPPPAFTKYQMPNAIDYQAAEVGGQIENIDYNQSGAPRAFGGGGASAATLPGITVNVQAMDARSFLDRSSDIAAAVKDAMLNLNSINDVVNDL